MDKSVLIDGDASFNAGNGDNKFDGADKLSVRGHSIYLGFKSKHDDHDHEHDDDEHDDDHDD
jgi:hypothetical protein